MSSITKLIKEIDRGFEIDGDRISHRRRRWRAAFYLPYLFRALSREILAKRP